MILSKKHPVITSSKILEEVAREKGIPEYKVKELYRVWRMYIRHLAQNTKQSAINFPKIGRAYYLLKNKSKDKELHDKKEKHILEELSKYERYNIGHYNVPIYKFYGLNRKNEETDKRFTLKEISNRQKETYDRENYEDAKLV